MSLALFFKFLLIPRAANSNRTQNLNIKIRPNSTDSPVSAEFNACDMRLRSGKWQILRNATYHFGGIKERTRDLSVLKNFEILSDFLPKR